MKTASLHRHVSSGGASYPQQVIAAEVADFLAPGASASAAATGQANVVIRPQFNPSLVVSCFAAVMQLSPSTH